MFQKKVVVYTHTHTQKTEIDDRCDKCSHLRITALSSSSNSKNHQVEVIVSSLLRAESSALGALRKHTLIKC